MTDRWNFLSPTEDRWLILWHWLLLGRWIYLTVEQGASWQSVWQSPERILLQFLIIGLIPVVFYRAWKRNTLRPAGGFTARR